MSSSRKNASALYQAIKEETLSAEGSLFELTLIEPNNAAAFRYVGLCYELNYFSKKFGDPTKAMDAAKENYIKAAKLGDDIAMYRLGLLYEHGINNMPPDKDTASRYYYAALSSAKHKTEALTRLTELAEANPPNASALAYLGLCHQHGYGHPKNTQMAQQLYKQAYEVNAELAEKILNIRQKLDHVKQIIEHENFIPGKHDGVEALKPLLQNNKNSSQLDQWAHIREVAQKRLEVFMGRFLGTLYRHPLLAKLYKAIKSNDEEGLKSIMNDLNTPSPSLQPAPKF